MTPAGTTLARGLGGDVRYPLRRAGDLFALRYGRALVEAQRTPGAIPVYGTNGRCGVHSEALFRGPGVILGRKGQGPLGVEWCASDYWVIDTAYSLCVLVPEVDLKFSYYLIKFVGLNHLKDGTSNPSLSRDTFGAQLFPLPTLAEQRAIAAVLGALDDKIDLNRRMNETLEETARALFKSWFVDFDPVRAKAEGRQPFGMDAATAALFPGGFEESELGLVPLGWRAGPVTELQAAGKHTCVAGPFGSNLTSKDYVAAGVPVIRGSNMPATGVWLRDVEFACVTASKADDLSSNLAFPGDVVFTQRGTLGQVAIIPRDTRHERFVISQSQMKLSVDSSIGSAFFVAIYFSQPKVVDYIVANGQQAGVPHINLGFLRTFKLLLPEAGVLRAFEREASALLNATRHHEVESRTLAELRDYLLPKLLSGEVRICDAEKLVEAAT